MDERWRQILVSAGVVALVALVLAIVVLIVLDARLRRLGIAPGANLTTILRQAPLGLMIAIDLLDLALDFFAAPVVWMLLGRYNLQGLRQLATLEALLPGTQLIPTLTLAWLFVRYTGWELPPPPTGRTIDAD